MAHKYQFNEVRYKDKGCPGDLTMPVCPALPPPHTHTDTKKEKLEGSSEKGFGSQLVQVLSCEVGCAGVFHRLQM